MPTKLGQYIALNPKIRPEERDALENVLTNDPDKLQQFIQLDTRMSDPEKDQLFGVFKSEMTPAQPGWGDVLTNIGTRAYGQMTEGVAGVAEAGAELVGGDPTAARNLRLYGRELAQPLPGSSSTQQFVSDVGSNVLSFAPALLAGGGAVAAGRKALGMAIPIVYGGVHSAGAEYGLAREKGYTPAQAAGVSTAAGASSAAWMTPVVSKLFSVGGKTLVAKMLGMVIPAGAAGVGMSLTHRGIEGFADSLADKQDKGLLPPGYTLGDAFKEAMYSGAVGVGIGFTTAAGEHVLGFSNKAARKELESRDVKLSVDEQDVTRYLENNPDVTPEERAGIFETLKRSTDERDAIAAELGEPKRGEAPATSAQLDRIAKRLNVLEPEIQKRLGDSSIPAEVRKSLSDGLDKLIAEYDANAEATGDPNWESTRAEVPPVAGPKPDSMTAPGRDLQPPTRFTTPEGEPGPKVPPPFLWGEKMDAPLPEIPPMSPTKLKDVLAGKVPSIPPTEETSATARDRARLMGQKPASEDTLVGKVPPGEEAALSAEDRAALAQLEKPQDEQRRTVGGFPPAAVETEPYRAATILQHVLETRDPEAARTFFAMDKALQRQAIDILKSEGVVKSRNEVQRRLSEVEGNPFEKPLPPKSQAAIDNLDAQRLEAEKLGNTPEGEELFPKVEAQEQVEGHSQAYLDETNRLLEEASAAVKTRKGSEPTSAETAEEYINRNPDRARGREPVGGTPPAGLGRKEPLFSFEYLIARKSVAAVKWLGTRLESVFRSAVDALGRGADYFSWAKDAVRRFGVGIVKTARAVWRSAVSGYREFTADLVRRGGVIRPEKMAKSLEKRGEALPEAADFKQAGNMLITRAPNDGYRMIAARVLTTVNKLREQGVTFNLKVLKTGDVAPREISRGRASGMTSRTLERGTKPPKVSVDIFLRHPETGINGTDYHTVLHEFVHSALDGAVSVGNLKSMAGTALGKAVHELFEIHNFLVRRVNQRLLSARAGKTELTEFERSIDTGANAFANPKETIAWALSDPKAQEYLKTIPFTAKESVWTKFVGAVRKFFGVTSSQHTAFDEILTVSEKLMAVPPQEFFDASSPVAFMLRDKGGAGILDILKKSGEPTKKLTEKEIIERRPFTEGQMAQAAKAGGLKAVQQEVGQDRTALVDMFGRAANILGEVATPKELADILNVMDYNQLKHKALQSGLTAEQREQRKIPFTDPNTGKTIPGKTEGPVTWAEQDRFARLSGKSWVDAANKFHADPTRPLGIVDETLLLRGVEAAHAILSAAQTVATNNPNSPKAQESMVMARNLYDAVIGARVGNDSLAGRALNAARRAALPDRNKAKLQRMIESQDVELTKAQNDLLAKLDPKNPRYIDHAKKILGLDTFSKFYSFYLGNILSGAATHTRNAISGITGLVSQVGESGVAAMLDIGLGRTKDTGRSLMDPVTLVLAYGNAFKDAGRVMTQAFFEGAPPEGLAKAMGPVESKAVKALTSDVEMQSLVKGEMMPRAIQGFVSKNPDALWRMIETPMHVLSLGGRVPQVTGNLLRATDLFFRVLTSVGKLNMDAVRAARKEGLSPVANRAEFEKFVGDRMTSPSPEALEAAAAEGMNRVFADPIKNDVVKWLLRAKASNSFLGRVLQLLLPFVKTPYNILKQGIERSPLGFAEVLERMKMDPAKGGLTREMLADELAKPVLGTILMGTAAYAVAMGWMTGAGPRDKADRDRERAAGRQPYSWRFKMGGKERYVGFDSMEPLLGTTMSMMVDAAEAMMRTPKDAPTSQIIKEAVYGTLGAVAKNLHNKTFLRGFWNGIDAASDPDRYMEGFVENFARGVAPASGLRKGMQNAIDPTRYRVDGPVDSYWAMFPTMAANGYLPDLDWLGRPKQMGAPADGVLGATFRLLSPVQYSEESQDPADLLANALGIDKSKPVAQLQGGKVELDPIQHNEYIRAQGLLTHRLLTGMAKNILPRVDTMSTRQKELLKKRIESTISGYRQNVVRNLTMKWKREGMK